MSHEFIEKLLSGSRNLDRMRADLDQAVSILLGLVQKDENWRDRLRVSGGHYSFEGGFWQLRFYKAKLHARLVENNSIFTLARYSTDKSWTGCDNGLYEDIPYSWNKLPYLVERLKKTFPLLESYASKLLEAAD